MLRTAALALLLLAGVAAVIGGAGDEAPEMLAIAAVNGVGVAWLSRPEAHASPAISIALRVVLCAAALLIVATQMPPLYAAFSPDGAGPVTLAAQWLRIAALFGVILGWLLWAMGRQIAGRGT